MHRIVAIGAVFLALDYGLHAATMTETVFRNNEEIRFLDGLGTVERWAPSEATVSQEQTQRAGERPTIRFHIDVDHHAGEAKYPIGWPRMYADVLRGMEDNWQDFDRFEFDIRTETNREALPQKPLNLQIHCPGKPWVTNHNLDQLAPGEWVTVSVPIADIDKVEQVARLGFNISEATYQHQDTLDFFLGGFRLVRSATCSVSSMTILAPAIFADRGTLPLALTVVGPPANVSRGIPMTLRRGERILRHETLPVQRGKQTLQVDVSELRLPPGDFTLTLFDADPEQRLSAAFRVVDSPWSE